MKTECENCKYYNRITSGFLSMGETSRSDYCNANRKYGKTIKSIIDGKSFKEIWFMGDLNKNHDCKYYKKDWYRFWIN